MLGPCNNSKFSSLYAVYILSLFHRLVQRLRYFRLPPLSSSELHASVLSRREQWWFITDVSVQPICPNFKDDLSAPQMSLEPIDCTETSVRSYHCSLHNYPEERRSLLVQGFFLVFSSLVLLSHSSEDSHRPCS